MTSEVPCVHGPQRLPKERMLRGRMIVNGVSLLEWMSRLSESRPLGGLKGRAYVSGRSTA